MNCDTMQKGIPPSTTKFVQHHHQKQQTASKTRALHESSVSNINAHGPLDELPFSYWDSVVTQLIQQQGVATIHLPSCMQELHRRSFSIARHAMDFVSNNKEEMPPTQTAQASVSSATPQATSTAANHTSDSNRPSDGVVRCKMIQSNENSANVTGYHVAGGSNSMSRYNEYREGFIFSNGETFKVDHHNEQKGEERGSQLEDENFEETMKELFATSLHSLANHILLAIERRLQLPINYFQTNMGPTSTSSQWHIKRYVVVEDEKVALTTTTATTTSLVEETPRILLPSHTDPSLISIVIHDNEIKGNSEGGGCTTKPNGLQYYGFDESSRNDGHNYKNKPSSPAALAKRRWIDIPCSGHSVATVFVGSVLSYVTGSNSRTNSNDNSDNIATSGGADGRSIPLSPLFPSMKHRVIQTPDILSTNISDSICNDDADGDNTGKVYKGRMAITLFVRPQPLSTLCVPNPCSMLQHVKLKRNDLTFEEWNARVSKNYMTKQRRKQNVKNAYSQNQM